MLDKIRRTIQKYHMLNPGEHVIAAVSGGPDSVALLHVLISLASEYELTLSVAHLNHGLRGSESDAEEQLVRQLSKERGISCSVKRIDLQALRKCDRRKCSLEDIGRQERYEFFTALAAEIGASRIALGHHREDQAETVLMNFIRGSGLEGLKGIRPVRDGCFIRPLLEVSRKDILDFLQAEHLPFLEDSSNSEDHFLRNRIRHHMIPLLQELYNPRIIDTLNRLAEIARREDDCLKSIVDHILEDLLITSLSEEGTVGISISRLHELDEALQHRLVKSLLERCALSPRRVAFTHIQAVANLCREEKSVGLLFLPGNVLVRREYDNLKFSLSEANTRSELNSPLKNQKVIGFSYALEIPSVTEIEEVNRVVKTAFIEKDELGFFNVTRNSACFDFDKIEPPLVIRNRREGDRFQPLGMAGTKKLKSYFIDEKVPRRQRDLIPLLADRHSVVWIAGLRLSERVRIDDRTRSIVKIEMI